MFPFLLPLLGAGAGALLDRKNPLRGAMLGGAGGALPGLLAAPAAAATNPALIESAAGMATHGVSSASPLGVSGLLGYAKPVGEAAMAANAVQGMTMRPQVQAPPIQQAQHSDPIGQMLAQQQQIEEQRRLARAQQMGFMYGRPT